MFSEIKKKMQAKFNELVALGSLYYVEVDRDEIWNVYLNAIPDGKRQGNNCNCCKSFLRQFGSIVAIKDNLMVTLWDFMVDDPEYAVAVKALREYVTSHPIKNVYLNTFKKCGYDKTPDKKNNVVWEHFYIELPTKYVKPDIGPTQAEALANKEVLERGLKEITDDAVDVVLELIAQNSLYKGAEFKVLVSDFKEIKTKYKSVKGIIPKNNFCWVASCTAKPAVTRINNSAIGTLLNNLSEGMELDAAVSAFERVVAPTNYKRSKAIVTPRMIDAAKAKLEELGLTGSLNRRRLSEKDLSINNTIFVHRKSNIPGDVFAQMKQTAPVNPKSLSKIESISIQEFLEKIVPTAKSISALVENKHLGNFVSLVGPNNIDDPTMFKWDNNFSWDYTGQVTDSIKERVKSAGGVVDGVLRISLSWNNTDDLDLSLNGPLASHVYFGNKGQRSKCGATLDVDANGCSGMMEHPVENIYWSDEPVSGSYVVLVTNYAKRSAVNQGYTVEVEWDGQVKTFSVTSNRHTGHQHTVFTFKYTAKDGFCITGFTPGTETESVRNYKANTKWGITTGMFVPVKAVTLSPNHWVAPGVGNKHYMFFLEGCVSDESTRGFYNEFLKESLMENRKVFEVLAGKIQVNKEPSELSGLGFSETVRNELIVEVTGTFRRLLRIKF